MPGYPANGQLNMHIDGFSEHMRYHTLDEPDYICSLYKRHLHVDLCELRLPVCAQILVTETTRDLKISFQASYHQQLFEQLRRLRQSEKRSGVYPTGHQVITRSLGSRFSEHRGFDLQETLFVQKVADRLDCPMTQNKCLLHLAPPQVEVAISQTKRFIHVVRPGIQLKRRCLRLIQYGQCVYHDFDLARRQIRVLHAFQTFDNLAFDNDHMLAAQSLSTFEDALSHLRVEDDLNNAPPVAQVDEDQSPVIPTTMHPTGQFYPLSFMLKT